MADLAYREVYAMDRVEARKHLVQTYRETGSISKTARLWHTSRQVVRKWVRRAEKGGEEALQDRSRRPRSSPRQTDSATEELVVQARQETGYGRQRLAWYLQKRYGLRLSPYTIRHILRRHGLTQPKKQGRKPFYPAFWAWEVEAPFTLLQADLKDILDKGALGTRLWDHIRKHRLPRYQWTVCESRSRLRFLAYSHKKTPTNGLTFLSLVLCWLRLHGVETPVTFQTDWGEEFGGDNPHRIRTLEKRFLEPLQGSLCRYPKGRKQYNGRVERRYWAKRTSPGDGAGLTNVGAPHLTCDPEGGDDLLACCNPNASQGRRLGIGAWGPSAGRRPALTPRFRCGPGLPALVVGLWRRG